MKKILFTMLALVLMVGLALPMAIPVAASNGSYVLYGIIGGQYLVTVDTTTGDATEIALLTGDQDSVGAIAFDPITETLYGLARADGVRDPWLATIDICTGDVDLIAKIDLDGETEYFAEGLAIDPDGKIYVSMSIDGGVSGGDYYSETLVIVDPSTAVAIYVATISNDTQDEADGLEFVGTTLYAADDPGSGPTDIYTIDLGTGVSTPKGTLSSPRFNNVNDMAYNPDSVVLYGFDPGANAPGNPHYVCTISQPGPATATPLTGPTHDPASEFGGGLMSGLAWASAECDVSIEITKEADRTHAYEGDTINYLYRVHNDGDVPLGPVVVTDSLPITPTPLLPDGVHNRGDEDKNGKLDPCETWYFTASYTVPDPCARTVIPNTGTAVAGTGLVSPTRVSAESNTVEVTILHPCIELEKWTTEIAYFNGTEITYYYGVHNCGDTPLDILVVRDTTLGEDATEVLGSGGEHNRGDLNNNGLFEPCETWYFSLNHTLECPPRNITYSDFCNTAMAGAFEPILESRIVVRDTWNVRIFQWLPRSKGYWGNWDNHWSDTEMINLIRYVNLQSGYFGFSGDGDPYPITKDDVHDLLLEKMKGKMDTDKAEKMLRKQLLAAWLSVKSYEGATDGDAATPGSLEAAMNPNATVYINGVADGTVMELLYRIEGAINSMDKNGLLLAKDILEKMNTAESNNYEMFMDPGFDPTSPCR